MGSDFYPENLNKYELADLIKDLLCDKDGRDAVFIAADAKRRRIYGNRIFIRGLIEFSNICNRDCYYCGLRKSNVNIERYRLSEDEILKSCMSGYELGFRTFVLQSGECPGTGDQQITALIQRIRGSFPDCAITLSVGERPYETYREWKNAGADRYLLRHESANEEHFKKLHPGDIKCADRKKALYHLKELGFQTGAGMMVGSPGQSIENLAEDLIFLRELDPQMVGIGPFLPQKDTPFAKEKPADLMLCVLMVAIVRLMLPNALIPATTALATLSPEGRKLGIRAGANVIMPNLSPESARKKYLLYDKKPDIKMEAAESLDELRRQIKNIGYEIVTDRGDYHV